MHYDDDARRRDADRQRQEPRAVLAGRGGRPARPTRCGSTAASASTTCSAAAGIPVARLADQDLDGVVAEVDLPVGRDAAVQPPRRRLPARVLPGVQPVDRRVLRDRARPARSASARPRCARPTRASPTSRRSRRSGLRGVMLPGMPPQADYDDPMYDEFWDAIVDLGLPPSFHILTSKQRRRPAPTTCAARSSTASCRSSAATRTSSAR